MAYDEDLADRLRAQLGGEPAVVEKKMFGGLAFMNRGHMAVVASGQGGLMVRVGADDAGALLQRDGVEQVEMRNRPMTGWVRVDAERLRTARQLTGWVSRGMAFTDALPPKR